MTTTKDKLEFVFLLARHTRATLRQCQALMRYAATLRAHDEKAKGAGVSISEIVKFNRIVKRVHKLCDEIGPTHVKVPHGQCSHCKHHGKDCTGRGESLTLPVFSGDPRDAVLKIRVPDGFTNDMGREGICVPS